MPREAPSTAVREQALGPVLLLLGWGPSGKSLHYSEPKFSKGTSIHSLPASSGCGVSSSMTMIRRFTAYDVPLKV